MSQVVTVIDSNGGSLRNLFHEVWTYRELFYVFSWRDIKIKYKQTLLGVVWVLFQPLVTVGIFSIFFGKIAKIPSGDLPYPLFVLVGIVIWNFFSSSLSLSSQSLISNEGILKKVYFPRIVLPISGVVTCFVDYFIASVFTFVAFVLFGYYPNWNILPIYLISTLIIFMSASGLGMATASINVRYRDVRYVLPFFIQIGLFITPVIYPVSVIYDYRKYLLFLNPLTGPIESIRAAFSGSNSFDYPLLFLSVLIALAIFIFGFLIFRATEKFFADIA